MKKIILAIMLVCGALLLNAQTITKLKNQSPQRLDMTQKDSVISMALKPNDGYDTEAAATFKNIDKDKFYEFSCDVDTAARNAVYLQVKLFKQKKMISRTSTVGNVKNKERLRADFNSMDADTIQLLVRIFNREPLNGKKINISNIYFGNPTEKKLEDKPRTEIVPGFNASSIYINNNGAKRADDYKAEVQYRKSGDSKWIKGLDLVYDESRCQARGSLLGLDENTCYEYIVQVNDNGKKESIKGKFTTRNSNFPIKKTIELTQKNAAELLKNIECGDANGYIRYTSKPGTVLKFGVKTPYAVDLTGLSYVIFENLTIKGGRRHCLNIESANDIIIRNCNLSGYGRVGKQKHFKDGKYFLAGKAVNYDAGINIQASERITVERCFIHDPLSTANSWFYSHPAGPTAVYIGDSASVVLRYNDFIGSDKHRWNDAVEGWWNGGLNGSVKADAEIYGNYFAFGNDDGMEMDGGQMNCRFAYNKSEGLLCGFSTAPCLIGPGYHFRNLVHRGGDEFDFVGVGVKNNYSTGGRGALFFFNNTVLDYNNGFSSPSFNDTEKKMHKAKYLKMYARNNLVRAEGPLYGKNFFRKEYYYADVDNDLFESKTYNLEAFRALGFAKKSVMTTIKFHDEKYGDYSPAHDSKAVGLGAYIPGVTPEKNITVGAFQKRGDELPLRHADFSVDRTVITLKMLNGETEQAVVTVTPKEDCRKSFKIIQPDGADFFSVTPGEGKFDGKPVQFIVRSVPSKIKTARRNTSAFVIKTCDGWSRPVSVEVDSRANPKLLEKARKNVIVGKVEKKGKNQLLTVDVPKEGHYWLIVKTFGRREYFMAQINNEKPEKRMVHFPRYNKNPWCALSTTIYQGKPNRPVKLPAGKTVVTIKQAEPEITAFAIAENADDYRLAPDDL